MRYGLALAVCVAAIAACFACAGSAFAGHPAPALPGLSEDQLLSAETQIIGEEHALEHAKERALSTEPTGKPAFGGSLSTATLAGDTGSLAEAQSLTAAAAADPRADTGAWSEPFELPLFAIHGATLPSGKVLFFGPPPGGFAPNETWGVLWNPATGTQTRVDPPLWRDPADGEMKPANIYCSGQAFLADGQLLVAGGTLGRTPDVQGLNKIYTFDPFTETWAEQPDMPHGRWYPTQVLLPDGRQVIISGYDEDGARKMNPQVELFNPPATRGGRGTLTLLDGELDEPGMPPIGDTYPHMFAMPSGRTLVGGPHPNDSWYLNTPGSDNQLSWEDTPNPSRRRFYGNAVLEPPPPGETAPSTKVLQLGGRIFASANHQSTATSESFDESDASPSWQPDEPYRIARTYQNTVLLPDGSMVAVGGGVGWDQFDGSEELKQVELWDPVTREWRFGAAQEETRAYHSVAVLLPDGRVISAGDNGNAPADATDTAEVYEPPYLFKGSRPTIASAPATINWDQPFGVGTADTDIDRAVLIAPGATTHATDMHQRYVPLELTHRAGGVDLVAPPNHNAAPPGYYMLFLINEAGVPSIAKFVRLQAGTAGRITIEKQTDPDDAKNPKTAFPFESDSPLRDFSLTDDSTKTSPVPAGEYTVTEQAVSSYALDTIQCNDSSSSGNVAARRATIKVAPGEHVTCTFTNATTLGAPSITDTDPNSPSSNNSPEVKGTGAPAGSTVRLYADATCTGTVVGTGTAAQFNGSTGITASVPANQTTNLRATATDTAGNTSRCSTAFPYTEDSQAPAAPSITDTDPNSPSSDNNPEVKGSGAEANSTVRLYADATCTGTAIGTGTAANFNGAAGITAANLPANQTTNLRATATDAVGNISPCSSAFPYTEDSQAAPPSITATSPSSPSNDNTPEVSGSGAETGSTVRIYADANCTGTVIGIGPAADFNGATGITVTVPANQTTNLRATATDPVGNISPCSSSFPYVEDSVAPAAPSITDTDPDSPANDNAPEVKGTAPANTTVRLYRSNNCSGEVEDQGLPAEFASPGLTASVTDNTTHQFSATATDAAGNPSACSSSFSYTEDSQASDAPAITDADPDSPANDNSPEIKGSAPASTTVRLYQSDDCTGTIEAQGSAASFSSPGLTAFVTDNATHQFTVTATDGPGNTSGCSSLFSYTEDSQAPGAPSITSTDPASPANDNTPAVRGSAENGSTVRLYQSNNCSGPVQAQGSAADFSSPGLTGTVADDSTNQFTATATDAVGNTSPCSAAFAYTEDSTGPPPPPDTTDPAMELSGKKTLKLGAAIPFVIEATTEDMFVSASGTVSVPGAAKTHRLKAFRNRFVARGTTRTLKLKLTKATRRAVRRFLLSGKRKRVTVRLVIRVRDSVGNEATRKRTVKLKL